MEIKTLLFDETKVAKGNYLSSFSMSGLALLLLSMDFCLSNSCNTTLVAIKRTSQKLIIHVRLRDTTMT